MRQTETTAEGTGKSGGSAHAPGKILLVVPPFQVLTAPALGVSLLKSCLAQRGFVVEVLYLNLRFAERVTPQVAAAIHSSDPTALLGDYVFSHALFERPEDHVDLYLREKDCAEQAAKAFGPEAPRRALLQVIAQAREFCAGEALEELLARDPWLVGFTSTFQQSCAALLLAAAVKKRRPATVVVMGGSNCEGQMGAELFARFPVLDFVAQGECDLSFPTLVEALAAGQPGDGIPGILGRVGGSPPRPSEPLTAAELEALPSPDFDDYFEQLGHASYSDRFVPHLLLQASRGCWWGAKHHCRFCGLNGASMRFRSRPPERVLSELAGLVQRHRVHEVMFVDNILDTRYFASLLPKLADNPPGHLFFATKANLTRQQVQLLARSGIRWIQPGLESLSDHSLKLMDKGTTRLHNIQLLKWCAEAGVSVTWYHLYGFPGELFEETGETASCMALLHHLEPPGRAAIISIHRFSPYFETPEELGLEQVRPAPAYRQVYPFDPASLARIAYYFESPLALEARTRGGGFRLLEQAIATWKQEFPGAHLLAIRRRRALWLLDTRRCAHRALRRLHGSRRRVYELCTRARTVGDLLRALQAEGDTTSEAELEETLRSFVASSLMVCERGRYLALATEAGPGYRRFVPRFPAGGVGRVQATAEGLTARALDALRRDGVRPVLAKARQRLRRGWVRLLVRAACRLSQP